MQPSYLVMFRHFVFYPFQADGAPKSTAQTRKQASRDSSGSESVDSAPKLTRKVHWPSQQHEEAYTSVRVNKQHKEVWKLELLPHLPSTVL